MSVYAPGLIVDTTPTVRRGETPPRRRPLRPGWLADDEQWRDQLEALEAAGDADWFAAQWELAGGAAPALDMSWLTTEKIR